MRQRHNPDARAYHEYYLNQAGRGYPVYVGTRYQRGHGLESISAVFMYVCCMVFQQYFSCIVRVAVPFFFI
jgi:phage gp36-like protein